MTRCYCFCACDTTTPVAKKTRNSCKDSANTGLAVASRDMLSLSLRMRRNSISSAGWKKNPNHVDPRRLVTAASIPTFKPSPPCSDKLIADRTSWDFNMVSNTNDCRTADNSG